MHEQAVLTPAHLAVHLSNRLEEGHGLDVAHRSAEFDDAHVGTGGLGDGLDPALDLVRDVWDDLNGLSQILPGPLLLYDGAINLAGGNVMVLPQVDVQIPLVIAKVEIGLRPVFQHEHLAMLEGVHGASVDVQIWIYLHGSDL